MLKIIAAVIILIGIVVLIRSRIVPEPTLAVRQVPAVVAQLAQNGKDGSWAVFMFTRNGAPHASDDADLYLQYAIENGRLGLEWELKIPGNIATADEFRACVSRHGYTAMERQMNGVRYLRVEGTALDSLGVVVLEECFGLHDDSNVDLVPDGFTWRP